MRSLDLFLVFNRCTVDHYLSIYFCCLVFNILWCKCLTFCTFNLKIEAAVGTDEEAGESNPEANELELSRVSEMRLILADPGQCILLN